MTTLSAEAAILHAVIDENLDEARKRIAEMLPGERRALANQAYQLVELIDEHEELMAAAQGQCRWYRNCTDAVTGYYTCLGSHYGVCATHAPAAREAGMTVNPLPKEVQL
jgi:hypothetical protein